MRRLKNIYFSLSIYFSKRIVDDKQKLKKSKINVELSVFSVKIWCQTSVWYVKE
jgi:hypothetical protein